MRALFLTALCLALAGCGAMEKVMRTSSLSAEGQAAYEAGRFDECVERYGKAVERIEAVWEDVGLPEREVVHHDRGVAYHGRGTCLQKLGRTKEAAADLEQAVLSLNAVCHATRGLYAGRSTAKTDCRQAADDTELLAQWRKK